MKAKEKTFYVMTYEGGKGLVGINEDGESVDSEFPLEIVFFNLDEHETKMNLREATELEKEYWTESMQDIDNDSEEYFGGVSLCGFEEWKQIKGYN